MTMKVLLTKRNRIDGESGEIVEVSPDRAAFLFSVNAAEPVPIKEQIDTPEKRSAKKTNRKK